MYDSTLSWRGTKGEESTGEMFDCGPLCYHHHSAICRLSIFMSRPYILEESMMCLAPAAWLNEVADMNESSAALKDGILIWDDDRGLSMQDVRSKWQQPATCGASTEALLL